MQNPKREKIFIKQKKPANFFRVSISISLNLCTNFCCYKRVVVVVVAVTDMYV
jgi:hypothetical protein